MGFESWFVRVMCMLCDVLTIGSHINAIGACENVNELDWVTVAGIHIWTGLD